MPFDLKQLKWAIAAYDLGRFRKAAIALGVQQSTISRRIRDLEDRMGASLFIRQTSGARPTDAGDRFIQHARKVLLQVDLASADRGVALASESMAETSFHGVAFVPLENETVDFSAIWSARNDNSAFRRLLSPARLMRR